ncbi:MAG: RNA polymerase sigma factor [Rhizobiaceae bacterium]|nr:RNA polymerase sigma factor [Rhizobiaceae bacterium]
MEAPRLIAGLARQVRDVGLAEELAQEALVAALQAWPKSGVPDRPGAWLMQTAKRKAIDLFRRNKRFQAIGEGIAHELEQEQMTPPDLDAALDDQIGDDLLGLIFTACHPVLSPEARTALTLRLLCGLTTEEIARAFLSPEPTIAQRIVRAKRALADAGVEFEVPRGQDLSDRLESVLEVIYLVFNEGYSATSGDDLVRPQLSNEAMRLARILAGLAAEEPEVHGLLALMEIQASRFAARVGPDGEPILLPDQNRARWDHLLIRRALGGLARAEALLRESRTGPGPYVLQAGIAACHARAKTADETDWERIVALYEALGALQPSPVIELNRAVAVSMARGPAAGLAIVDGLRDEPALKTYHLLPGVRADLLAKLGRHSEARADFEHAASLARNERERAHLLKRAAESAAGT